MHKAAFATLFALVASAPTARAEGSVGFEQADVFLKQAPEIRAHLMETLCISENGMAVRLAGEYPLGGLRIGPYKFQARPKGQPNGPHFELWITTYQIGYDANGQELVGKYGAPYPPVERMYSIKETFKSAELRIPQYWVPGLASVNCDEKVLSVFEVPRTTT